MTSVIWEMLSYQAALAPLELPQLRLWANNWYKRVYVGEIGADNSPIEI